MKMFTGKKKAYFLQIFVLELELHRKTTTKFPVQKYDMEFPPILLTFLINVSVTLSSFMKDEIYFDLE